MGTAKLAQCWLPAEGKVQKFYTAARESHDGKQTAD